jgi:mono/diheme cytochrome c family protein
VAGGSGIGGMVNQVASRFAAQGDPAAKQALANELGKLDSAFAKKLLADLNAKPVAPVAAKEKKFKPDASVHERGKAIYNMTCIACHQPEGQGLAGVFPPLDASDWVTGDPELPVRIVIHGLQGPVKVNGTDYTNVMPPVAEMTDEKIADVVTYVRQTWSNDAAPVSVDEVRKVREKYKGRTEMWSAKELGR